MFITFTSDFGVQTQGIGIMEAVAFSIAPNTKVIHLMHGLPSFDIRAAARTLETIQYLPIGCHVCVVDPGVGTKRRGIIIKTKRGDYFIGPDNGIFIPAVKILGGCEIAVEITNKKYMRRPVSPIFHGRDVFTPAAAHLSLGVKIKEFGREIKFESLVKAPYEEATLEGNVLEAEIIQINKYGSLHLNILNKQWDGFAVRRNQSVIAQFKKRKIKLSFVGTFGDVKVDRPLILKDDYGRVEIAVNMGNFAAVYGVKIGDKCIIKKL